MRLGWKPVVNILLNLPSGNQRWQWRIPALMFCPFEAPLVWGISHCHWFDRRVTPISWWLKCIATGHSTVSTPTNRLPSMIPGKDPSKSRESTVQISFDPLAAVLRLTRSLQMILRRWHGYLVESGYAIWGMKNIWKKHGLRPATLVILVGV